MSLYTFGYEGLNLDTFIARLHKVGVKTIIDVRELPLSRKRGFSKRSFAAALADAGIAYAHMPTLGCPKPIRDAYRVDRDWHRYTVAFNAYLKTHDASLRELAKISRTTAACLVCFEADHNFCHRTYVARAARRFAAPAVVHINSQTTLTDSPLRVAA